MKWFWRWLTRFAYRRWAPDVGPKPVGVPGNRDPDAPCDGYAPRRWRPGDFQNCQTDGHYLCRECCHMAPEVRAALEGETASA